MRIESLTSLRFFAALMVMLSHFSFLQNSDSATARFIYSDIIGEGYVGVTFFFILSGFILSHSYSRRFQENSISTGEFICARIARIYPLHILTFILSLPLAMDFFIDNSAYSFAWIPNVFLLHAFFPDGNIYFAANGPSWSLSDELFFYLLFPVLLFRKAAFLFAILAVGICWQSYVMTADMSSTQKHFSVYIMPLSRLFDFVVGILLYRIFTQTKERYGKFSVNFMQVSSVLLLLVFFLSKSYIDPVLRYDVYYVLPMAFLIYSFGLCGGYLSNMISSRFWLLLGEASFSFYMIHQLVIRYVTTYQKALFGFEGVSLDIAIAVSSLATSIILSIFLYKFFELRAKKFTFDLLKRVFKFRSIKVVK